MFALHVWHVVADKFVLYVPGVQKLHVLAVAEKFPMPHCVQLIEPGESANVPAVHVWHAVDDVFGLMEPARQLLHVGWLIAEVNWPGAQLEHMALDDRLQAESTYSPTLHVRHVLQLKRLDALVKVLAEQFEHLVLFMEEQGVLIR